MSHRVRSDRDQIRRNPRKLLARHQRFSKRRIFDVFIPFRKTTKLSGNDEQRRGDISLLKFRQRGSRKLSNPSSNVMAANRPPSDKLDRNVTSIGFAHLINVSSWLANCAR
jgi:hypothetical protein